MRMKNALPQSFIFPVEPERKNLTKIKTDPVNKAQLQQICPNYTTTSIKEGQEIIFEYNSHPVFEGFVDAYRNHRPITISPDIIWLLIIQAFSHHVRANSEELRPMFVNFNGKKELVVKNKIFNFETMTKENYEQVIFPQFVEQISEYTGKGIIDTLSPDFTTTTTTSLAVGQISIMSAMNSYFMYNMTLVGCGFPYITIEGLPGDWRIIISKLNELKKFKFDRFTNKIAEIIEKIIQTMKGNIDLKFWKEMIRIKNDDGSYSNEVIDGWFTNFFPYDSKYHERSGPIKESTNLPREMLSVPFVLEIIDPSRPARIKKCEMLAGFVGLTQNKENASLKPEIGWFVRPRKEIPQHIIDKLNKLQMGGNRI